MVTADSNCQIQASRGQSAQGNIFASTQVIQAGFWFASTKLCPELKKNNILLLVLPAIMSQYEK